MATQLLPIANTPADSATITLADGESAIIWASSATTSPPLGIGYIDLWVEMQGSDSAWSPVYLFRAPDNLTAQLNGPGVYRVRRGASPTAVGAQRA